MAEITTLQSTDAKGRTFLLTNPTPTPGDVASRNGDYRKWFPAGVPWSVKVTVGGAEDIIASEMSRTQPGKIFCLHIMTRVSDNAVEPPESVEEKSHV